MWPEYGFKTGKIVLPGIQTIVDLEAHQWFRFDGIVDDLGAYYQRLGESLDLTLEPGDETGICHHFNLETESRKEELIVVAVEDLGELIPTLFTIGHESTHAITYLNQGQRLVEELRTDGFDLNPYQKYTDKEDICHIGGLFALYRFGLLDSIDHSSRNDPVIQLLEDLLASRR
ncbi:hypothetical protein HY495_00340 [Candidatus Woesearchaeota archaeon]|nr:hypothetical protein [Candidatus Woesearchaeota archaeon]